jgi:hypothetical protein
MAQVAAVGVFALRQLASLAWIARDARVFDRCPEHLPQ